MLPELDERKKKILYAIIHDYLNTAEPVGSRSISRKYKMGLSPATIRNEMADLEEVGLIEQPHTSSGRIPSDKGYRYYVDKMMKTKHLSAREEHFIDESFAQAKDIDDLLHQSLKVITALSNYVTIVVSNYRKALKERIYSAGISHIIKEPEFNNMERTKRVLEILEQEELLANLMHEYASEKATTIKIGHENKLKQMKDLSMVVTTYKVEGNPSGSLAIIGPTRMLYDKATSIAEEVAKLLSKYMEE